MDEEIFHQQHRTAVRGSLFSFHLPWGDIMYSLAEALSDEDLAMLPHTGDASAHMIRLSLRIGIVELAKHLKDARLRGHVVLGLWRESIEAGRRAYAKKKEKKTQTASGIFDKNATPASGAKLLQHVFEELRPMAVLEERTSDIGVYPNAQHATALQRYSILKAQTDMKCLPSMVPSIPQGHFPFTLGPDFGGAEYTQSQTKAKQNRRVLCRPWSPPST